MHTIESRLYVGTEILTQVLMFKRQAFLSTESSCQSLSPVWRLLKEGMIDVMEVAGWLTCESMQVAILSSLAINRGQTYRADHSFCGCVKAQELAQGQEARCS